jgi:hypothetical protein
MVWQLSMGMGMPRPVRKEGMQEGNDGEQSKEEEEKKKDE